MEAHSLAQRSGGLPIPRSRKLLATFGDERLVEQLRRGNDTAFEVLYDRHHRGVLSYCRHMLGSRDEAEDALQQAFVSAHADIVSSDKPIRFKAWIYTIARNRCLSMLRARREQPSEDLELVSTAGLTDEVQQRADLQQLLADMQELPEDQRAALILSELGDLSHAEVAEVVGCEATKVKSLVFQARSGLIERRQARETPCEEIREQLATLRGGSLRRGPLRRHLKACPSCSAFRDDVKRQRQMVAAILPVIPTLGLRESAFAAVGMGGASTAGGVAAGGGTGTVLAAKAGATKIAVIALATGGAVGGGVAVERAVDHERGSRPAAVQEQAAPAPATPAEPSALDANGRARSRGADSRVKAERDARHDDASARTRGETGGRQGTVGKSDIKADDPPRGFIPVQGVSNGERARDFAQGRGDGNKRGLDKQSARADRHSKNGKAHARHQKNPHPEHPASAGAGSEKPQHPTPGGPLHGPSPAVPPTLGTPPPSAGFPHRTRAADQQAKRSAESKPERRADAPAKP